MVKTPRANCLSRAQAGASWAGGSDKADTRHFSFSRRGYARTLTERSIRASGFFLPLGPPSSLGCFGRRRRGFQLGVFELGHGRVAAAVATRDPRPTPSRSHTLTSLPYLHGVFLASPNPTPGWDRRCSAAFVSKHTGGVRSCCSKRNEEGLFEALTLRHWFGFRCRRCVAPTACGRALGMEWKKATTHEI